MTGFLALVGAIVACAFAARLWLQYTQRQAAHALAWSLSLLAYGVGMIALAAGLLTGWPAPTYGLYWLTGALINVPMLAVGELHLLFPKRSALWWTIAMGATVWSVAAVLMSTFDAAALQRATADGGIPLGAAVLGDAPAYAPLRPLTLTGTIVVVVGTLWSAVRRRRPAVLLIVLGVLVAASSSGFVRSDLDAMVPVALTAGVAFMYVGFRATSGRPPVERPAPAAVDLDRH